MMSIDRSRIGLMELHDARLGHVLIRPGGNVDLSFPHLAVYVEVSEERYDVWSCEVVLRFEAAGEVLVRGAVDAAGDYVSEADFYDQANQRIDDCLLLDAPARRVTLQFGRGALMSFGFERAVFEQIVPTKKLEEWIGPL